MSSRSRLVGLALVGLMLSGCAAGAEQASDDAESNGSVAVTTEPADDSSDQALTVCDFADPSIPTANAQYPLTEPLTAQPPTGSGPDVRAAVTSIQEILLAEGFTGAAGNPVVVDGSYGPDTAHAVQQFQRQAGITADGTVGQETWSALGTTYCWRFH